MLATYIINQHTLDTFRYLQMFYSSQDYKAGELAQKFFSNQEYASFDRYEHTRNCLGLYLSTPG
jgi:hypothetical protein